MIGGNWRAKQVDLHHLSINEFKDLWGLYRSGNASWSASIPKDIDNETCVRRLLVPGSWVVQSGRSCSFDQVPKWFAWIAYRIWSLVCCNSGICQYCCREFWLQPIPHWLLKISTYIQESPPAEAKSWGRSEWGCSSAILAPNCPWSCRSILVCRSAALSLYCGWSKRVSPSRRWHSPRKERLHRCTTSWREKPARLPLWGLYRRRKGEEL